MMRAQLHGLGSGNGADGISRQDQQAKRRLGRATLLEMMSEREHAA
jgi:hypothetical protein